jgi:hypothetical protein
VQKAEKVQVSGQEKSAKCAQGVRTCRSPEGKQKSPIVREETGGERSGDLGVRAPEDFPRENGNLREVAKSGVNPDHWIWKGHVEEIHTFQRSGAQKKRGGETKERLPKAGV